jgi:hypothetical protein
MKSKGVVAASIRSSRGPAGGDSCELLVANTSTCRQLRRGDLLCSCATHPGTREVTSGIQTRDTRCPRCVPVNRS